MQLLSFYIRSFFEQLHSVALLLMIMLATYPSQAQNNSEDVDWSKFYLSANLSNTINTIKLFKRINNDVVLNGVTIGDRRFCDSFSSKSFYGKVDFSNDTFLIAPNFKSDSFLSEANFDYSVFYKRPDFLSVSPKKKISFYFANFKSGATFSSLVVNDTLDFTSTKFAGSMDFSSLNSDKNAFINFTDATLPDTLDFSRAININNDINLETANFDTAGRITYINLCGSDISKFHIDYLHFKLYFDSGARNEENENITYQSLLNNFKARGQNESYELLDIEYNDLKWKKKLGKFSYLSAIPYHWNHYGYSRGRVFLWSGVLLFIFTILTFFHIDKLHPHIYEIESIPCLPSWREINKHKENKHGIRKHMWYSFIYTSEVFFHIVIRMEKLKFNTWWQSLYILVVYTMGILCLAYMANFVLH